MFNMYELPRSPLPQPAQKMIEFANKRYLISMTVVVVTAVVILLMTGGSSSTGAAEDTSASVEQRLEAIRKLNTLHDEQSTAALRRLVDDPDPRIVVAGLRGLSQRKNVPPKLYLDHLDSENASVREAAAIGIGSTRDLAHHVHLIEMLKTDPDPIARAAAARGLGDKTNWDAVPALIGGLRDKDLMVRKRTAATMNRYVRSFRIKADQPEHEREKTIKMLIKLLESNGVRTR
jgi:hypothetical protein